MDKGVLLLAFGKRGYGFMAHNLSLSIKHYSPTIPIHLIATREVVKEVTDKSVFDSIEWLEDSPQDPGLFKAEIGRRLPFQHTLFLDVDALCIQPLEPLFERLIASGTHYATYINATYDINSPNILPDMYWAYKDDIWKHYGFDDKTKFPATQSSIQFIKKCDKTAELYDLFNEAFADPIPLERLRNKWGGGQPDELYLNVALAKQGEFKHIGIDSMWFGNNGSKRPHELCQSHYFISYFGYRNNIRPFFWEYYDKLLTKIHSQRGTRHIFKSHLLKGDKIANIGTNRVNAQKTSIGSQLVKPNTMRVNKKDGNVALFVSYYEQNHPQRQRELRRVMEANIGCSSIDVIYNLGTPWENPKVVNLEGYDRPTYADFIKEMQTKEHDFYILANSDIYFTNEIESIKDIQLNGKVMCLSRWDVMTNGYAKLFNYEWSQDTWVFKGKPPMMTSLDFTMGFPACDNRFAYEIAQVGLLPINPSLSVKTYHLHQTNKRSYSEKDRLAGAVMPVKVENDENYRKKRLLLIQPGKVGDIIICLPIANYYSKKGYEVEWQCQKQYHDLFQYVDYVKPVVSRSSHYDKVIDISFGIDHTTDIHRLWLRQKSRINSFVELKYQTSEVPLVDLRCLNYDRKHELEESLFDLLGCSDGNPYILVHRGSDYGTPIDLVSDKRVIYFEPIGDKNYQIFDWRKVIENASEIHCIDSSLCNFVDALSNVNGQLHYYVTDKVPMKADRTMLTKNWKVYDLV